MGHDDDDLVASLPRSRSAPPLSVAAGAQRIEVRLIGVDAYQLTLRPLIPKFWRNYTLVSSSRLGYAQVLRCLSRARANDRAWANEIAWHAPRKPTQGRMAALIAFFVFAIPYAIFGGYALYTHAPGVDLRTFAIGFVAIAVIASFIAWIDFFFGVVRVRIAAIIGRWLGGRVSESHGLDAGTWNLQTSTATPLARSLWLTVLVGAIDLAVLLAGVVLPVAAVAITLFLAFDR